MSLLYTVSEELVPYYLLIYDILAEVETVDAVDKVVFWNEVTRAILDTLYTVTSILQILNNLLETKNFVPAQNYQSHDFLAIVQIFQLFLFTENSGSRNFLKHHLASRLSLAHHTSAMITRGQFHGTLGTTR